MLRNAGEIEQALGLASHLVSPGRFLPGRLNNIVDFIHLFDYNFPTWISALPNNSVIPVRIPTNPEVSSRLGR
jgi:hypothetical protein